jgi:flavin-dependent dehydrogenase
MIKTEYDVVIMGAGLAGLCQARHLMLKVPNIKIALIDPLPEARDPVKDLKIGESTVELAAIFLANELGLYEYLIENHLPKHGLNFHWPKTQEKTENIDDYYSLWVNRNPALPAFQINRSKLEKDLLQMVKQMGVEFINGRVVDVDLTPKDNVNLVTVKIDSDKRLLKAQHLIDAAGRKFIIGRKTDNLVFEPENLMGLNNGSAWMRVKNIDRDLFHNGYDPIATTVSHYYGTNHFFGHGHWLWMIPIDKNPLELSIGVMHHHEELPANKLNTQEKFLDFLQANHKILYNLITSGEPVDFNYRSRVAHRSKTMFSEDNWYVIGDAAYIFDAFYSYGSSTIALAIESVTEIIRAKFAKEADAEEKRRAYNGFNLAHITQVNSVYHKHSKQLGNASVMSWRIYFEFMWWFGLQIPMYLGKWHLNPTFIKSFIKLTNANCYGLFSDLHEQFDELVKDNANLGLLNCYRADQLIGHYSSLNHFDDFLENAKLEPLHTNIFGCFKTTCFYTAIWYVMLQWKGFGIKGLLNPRHIYHFCRLLGLSFQGGMGEFLYKLQNKGMPDNTEITKMRKEFERYQYQPKLQAW